MPIRFPTYWYTDLWWAKTTSEGSGDMFEKLKMGSQTGATIHMSACQRPDEISGTFTYKYLSQSSFKFLLLVEGSYINSSILLNIFNFIWRRTEVYGNITNIQPYIILQGLDRRIWEGYTGIDPAGMFRFSNRFPDSKVHGANMGPIWVLSAPDGPHVGPWTLPSGFPLWCLGQRMEHWPPVWYSTFRFMYLNDNV